MSDQNTSLPPVNPPTASAPAIQVPIPIATGTDAVSNKQVMIGAGAFVVLAVIFFFIRNAFVNYLVGSLKRAPNSAGFAGWGLFGGLLFAAALGTIALVNASYLTIAVLAPLAALSLLSFLLAAIVAAKK